MANPNPDTSGLKPFQPGQSGNPGGITSEQRRLMMENAEMALRIRHSLLKAKCDQLDQNLMLPLDNETLTLVKSSEDRGFGQPQQHVEVKGKLSAVPVVETADWAAKHGAEGSE